MSFGRTLFITFALLAYLGQALAFAEPACQGMGDADLRTLQSVEIDTAHMHHDMGADQSATDQAVAGHGDDCCGSQCQCIDEGCHSPIPAVSSTSELPAFGATSHTEQQLLQTISSPFYLYKPPILS